MENKEKYDDFFDGLFDDDGNDIKEILKNDFSDYKPKELAELEEKIGEYERIRKKKIINALKWQFKKLKSEKNKSLRRIQEITDRIEGLEDGLIYEIQNDAPINLQSLSNQLQNIKKYVDSFYRNEKSRNREILSFAVRLNEFEEKIHILDARLSNHLKCKFDTLTEEGERKRLEDLTVFKKINSKLGSLEKKVERYQKKNTEKFLKNNNNGPKLVKKLEVIENIYDDSEVKNEIENLKQNLEDANFKISQLEQTIININNHLNNMAISQQRVNNPYQYR